MRNHLHLFLISLSLLGPLSALAQLPWPQVSPNPDSYGYTWRTNTDPGGPAYIWEDISVIGTQVTGLNDDGNVGPIQMGIEFPYYWYTRDEVWIADNGFIAFSKTPIGSGATGFPPTPTPSDPNDVIAVFMADMNPTGPGNPNKVYYYSDTATKRFIVSWESMPFWVPPTTSPNQWQGANSFQVILDANDSSITFNYKTLTGSWAASYNQANYPFVVGIENVSGTFGLMPPALPNANPAGQRPVESSSVRFYPPVTPSSVRDVAVTNVQNDEVQAFFVPWETPPATTDPNFFLFGGITNVGNTDVIAPIPVIAQVKDLNNLLFYQARDTAKTGLEAGQTQYFKFQFPFYPPNPGSYIFTVRTENPGLYADLNTTNDLRTNEAVVVDTTLPEVTFGYSSGLFDNLLDANGGGLVSWAGNNGNSGAAAFYESYGYPISIKALEFFVARNATDTTGEGFLAQIYGVDTTSGAVPGPLLYSETVSLGKIPATPATPNTPWVRVDLDTPLVVESDGFYVAWIQRSDSSFLFTEASEPISRRSYEILNGGWSIYRSNSTDELWVRAIVNIEAATIDSTTSIERPSDNLQSLNIYPNPSDGLFEVHAEWLTAQPAELKVYDLQGRKVYRQQAPTATSWTESLDLTHLEAGVYLLQVNSPDGSSIRRLVIR